MQRTARQGAVVSKDKPDWVCFSLESELGWLTPVAANGSLLALIWTASGAQGEAEVQRRFPGARRERDECVVSAVAQLEEYLAGRRRHFSVPIDLGAQSAFSRAVLLELSRVPYGRSVSYGELAALSGYPAAARAVGRVMARNPLPLFIPCHRVVGRGGQLVGYSGEGGLDSKSWLLALELRHLAKDETKKDA